MSTSAAVLDPDLIEFRSAVAQLCKDRDDRTWAYVWVESFWQHQLNVAQRQQIGEETINLMKTCQRVIEITGAQKGGPSWSDVEQVYNKPVGTMTAEDIDLLLDYMATCRAIHQSMLRYLAALSVFGQTLANLGLGAMTRQTYEAEVNEHTEKRDQATDRLNILKQQLEQHGVWCPENEERWIMAKEFDNHKIQLQVLCDGNGNVIDRRIRKEENIGAFDNTGLKFWKDDPGNGQTVPNEWYLQNKCWREAPENTVRLSEWSFNEEEQIVTYYICYCPHGDLDSIYGSYRIDQGQVIPEPVLWYIFLRLTQACLIMERGDYTDRQPEWLEIVHRDIKPGNIFLDHPDPNMFPAYPLPKLADFGFAIETHAHDDQNPGTYADYGTPPFLAPEQVQTILPAPSTSPFTPSSTTPYKILSPTNIWAIGMVMVELTSGAAIGSFEQKTYEHGPEETQMSAHAREHYSRDLRQLIRHCVAYYPNKRPEVRTLYDLIWERMLDAPGTMGRYMLDGTDGRQEAGGEMEWRVGKEKYVLDLAL